MTEPQQVPAASDEVDTDSDRYPNVHDVLARIGQLPELEDAQVERVEVHCFASGEATYRVWPARAEEPEQGYWAIV